MDLNRVTVYTTQEALELVGYTLEQAGIPQYELVEDSQVVPAVSGRDRRFLGTMWRPRTCAGRPAAPACAPS